MTVRDRLTLLDWPAVEASLWQSGFANTGPILTPAECAALISPYPQSQHFRSRVQMERYRFGSGDYQYFAEPLPGVVSEIRDLAYPPLARVANAWGEVLGTAERFGPDLRSLHADCAAAGQTKPTPLLLHYEAGGYNCLHQDLYGAIAFPLQLVILLSEPGQDFTGGEFLLLDQRPRAQSVGHVVPMRQTEAVIFTTRRRPVPGKRGHYAVNVKHGVSKILSGRRYTLGVIFHNAE